MPFDRKRYPANWHEISRRIRERAGHRCEWCGVPNYAVGHRDEGGLLNPAYGSHPYECAGRGQLPYKEARKIAADLNRAAQKERYIVVVLTVAHVDDPDPMNCDEGNLRLLCNRCHLKHDAQLHAANAKATRDRKAGQFLLAGVANA